jgi:predicted nucleic acid-binding Zn ribbon protein
MERRLAASKGFVELAAVGYCHYCESPVPEGHKFCDRYCAEDWAWERDRRKQNLR